MGRLAGVKPEAPSSNITGRLAKPATKNQRQPVKDRTGQLCGEKLKPLAASLHTRIETTQQSPSSPDPSRPARTVAPRFRSLTCRLGHPARDLRSPYDNISEFQPSSSRTSPASGYLAKNSFSRWLPIRLDQALPRPNQNLSRPPKRTRKPLLRERSCAILIYPIPTTMRFARTHPRYLGRR